MDPITITTADTPDQLRDVHRLTYEAYLAEGLCGRDPSGRLQHYPHLDGIPETTVVTAMDGNKLVGTVSITVDGPAGLHVDEDFPEVMSGLRASRGRVAAAWRIVTDPAYRGDRRLITLLMRAGFAMAVACNADRLCCSFHPRRQKVHRRLGFFTVAYGRCRVLNRVEAVLMMYELRQKGIPEQLRRKRNL